MQCNNIQNFLRAISPPDIFSSSIHAKACRFYVDKYQDFFYDVYDISFNQENEKSIVKRKAEYLAGRYCAKLSLDDFNIENFTVRTGDKREPLWPTNIVGSISHSDSYAIAITSNCESHLGIGVDVELCVNRATAIRLKPQIFTEEEDTRFSQLDNFPQIFILFFSLKESFFKAAFPIVRRYFDFSAVTIKEIDWRNDETGSVRFQLNVDLCETLRKGKTFTARFCQRDQQTITSVEINAY